MKRKWIFFVAPPGVILFVALIGGLVMQLWNWLLPALFGWHPIGFWQALGLLVLCRILFGGFGGHGPGPGPSKRQRRWAERWEQMTPEEREKFRQGGRGCCGGVDASPQEAGEQT
jgi:hypothetical protein